MQGRLVPKINGQYQAFPKEMWLDEFIICRECGIKAIEWIVDLDEIGSNPILNEEGRKKISNACIEFDISIDSLCADVFIQADIMNMWKNGCGDQVISLFDKVIEGASLAGVSTVVLPLIEEMSMLNKSNMDAFIEMQSILAEVARRYSVIPALELDIGSREVGRLFDVVDPIYRINYDTGNSASKGYDALEELQTYGELIVDIHIKDRLLGGGPVKLGSGDTNFEPIISYIQNGYTGLIIYQAYRDDQGINVFLEQKEYFETRLIP